MHAYQGCKGDRHIPKLFHFRKLVIITGGGNTADGEGSQVNDQKQDRTDDLRITEDALCQAVREPRRRGGGDERGFMHRGAQSSPKLPRCSPASVSSDCGEEEDG